ncbi:MAG: GIY-YIG nuclease family protein [candidate division WOR-3 bacterium]|nr:GIY-YIG nuclease family protein [candidate division WOR-3 bacterium]
MYYVYVLKSMKDNKLYTGYTENLMKRIERHNLGRVKSTKHRRPFKLIYAESYANKSEAISREKYLKSLEGRIWLKKQISMVSVAQFG